MNYVSVEQDGLDMTLTQMGAQVKSIHGLLCFVRFDIDGTELFYVYNINAKNQYYLQKVLPYPVGAGIFSRPADVIAYIKRDIKLFKNAAKSRTFQCFIETNTKIHKVLHKTEDTFLNYNVPIEKLKHISEMLDAVERELADIQQHSPKIEMK